jgi:hypothetical protein
MADAQLTAVDFRRLTGKLTTAKGYTFFPEIDGSEALAATSAVSRGTHGAAFESLICSDAIYPQAAEDATKVNYLDASGVLIQNGRILRVIGVPFVIKTTIKYSDFSTVTDKNVAVVEMFECDAAFLVHDVFFKTTTLFTGPSPIARVFAAFGRDDKEVDENQNFGGRGIVVDGLFVPHDISATSGRVGWGATAQGTAKGVEHPSTDQLLYGSGGTTLFPGNSQLLAYFEATGTGATTPLSNLTAGEISFYMLVTILENPEHAV